MNKYSRYVLLMLLCLCCCRTGFADSVAYVKSYPSDSLWKSEIASNAKPVLLYGHNVADNQLTPSPDGRYIAAQITPVSTAMGIFDTRTPGTRRLLEVKLGDSEEPMGEWTPDGRGVLVAKYSQDMDSLHRGIYAVYLTGQRKLIASPVTRNLLVAYAARYSPDKRLLAVEGDNWLQVVRLTPKAKTVMFKKALVNPSGLPLPLIWIDSSRLVLPGSDRLLIVDVAKQSIKTWFAYDSITGLVYSNSRNRLYATMQISSDDEYAFYSINPATGGYQQIPLAGLDVFSVCGVTANGKTVVVNARERSSPGTAPGSIKSGIWAVDLDTGEHLLIAEGVTKAVVLPSPTMSKKIAK